MTFRGTGSTAIVFSVVLLLIVGGLGLSVGMQSGAGPRSEAYSTSTSTYSSAYGLNLTLTSSASELPVGHNLTVSLSIVNTLPKVNSVKPSFDWLMHGVPVGLWPACYFGLPAQAAVLQGYYDTVDIQSATSVAFEYICMEGVTIDHVIFQPNSDQANITGLYDVTQTNETIGPFNMSLSFTTGGYWNLQNLSQELNIPILAQQGPRNSPDYIPFTPGYYTVAVADEWGQIALLHFTVTPTGTMTGGFLVHVIDETSGQPVTGVRVVAGPASSPTDAGVSPGGPILSECVHGVPSGSAVLGNGSVVLPNGTEITFPPCPLSTYSTNSSGWVSIPQAHGAYYFFDVGGIGSPYNIYGVVPLPQLSTETIVTVNWPNGSYTVTH